MKNKVTLSSSSTDLHGDTQTIEMLKQGVTDINGANKVRMLINHRRDLPPIGYWNNAELEYHENLYLLKAEPIYYTKKEIIDSSSNLIKESFVVPVSFIERPISESQSVIITFDKNNFHSWEVIDSISKKLSAESDEPIEIRFDTRKEFIPDPRLVITLTTYYTVIYPFLKPFLKKLGEKIAEDIGDDIYQYSKKKIKSFAKDLKRYISIVRLNSNPKSKKLITIFEIPGDPYVELHAHSDDADLIVNAITTKKILKIHERIEELNHLVKIKEVHFKLNEKGNWKFTYLIAQDGSIIGTKDIMDKREYWQERINLSPTKGFSMGADVKYIKKK